MRILLDAYWWFDGPPSGRNVVRSIVGSWAEEFPGDKISLLIPRRNAAEVDSTRLAFRWPNVSIVFTRVPQHAIAAALAGGLRRKYDLVLTQNFAPVFTKSPRAVFVHDLMFLDRPEWFTPVERTYLRMMTRMSRRADAIFTSSRSEAARIVRHLPKAAAPITAAGLALSADYEAAVPKALDFAPEEFLLTVGRINIRKNLEGLVRSLLAADLITEHRPLIIVGRPDGAQGSSHCLTEATSNGLVIWAGTVSDGELKWAYQNCRAFIFPSLDEGFGLPVLEAISEGAPMALSDIPAFREFGNVGSFFDPNDDSAIADCVAQVLSHQQQRTHENPSLPNWSDVVTKLRDWGPANARNIRQGASCKTR